ncbi:MAG: nucleotidyl transferase AbiEii/AbiGii toxin family protein [Dermatophilaceae bacterium]
MPSTRSTRDIDLYRSGLIRLASIDLGDHFRFEYAGHTESIGTETQPYTEGYQVKFTILIGAASKETLQVDLAVGAGMTGEVVTTEPATTLHLPRLTTHPYRLYPTVDQIADKVCATMTEYRDRSSSREKDLVDLVAFATTQDIDGTALRLAITTEARRRKMEPFDHFAAPSSWARGYARLAKPVPSCADYASVDSAAALVARLIDPALSGDADDMAWDHSELDWSAKTSVPKAYPAP